MDSRFSQQLVTIRQTEALEQAAAARKPARRAGTSASRAAPRGSAPAWQRASPADRAA
jgi:hypothetical protein